MEEDDWGLHAVVRSYVAATNTSTTTTASTVFPADFSNQTCFSSFTSGVGEQSGNLFSVSDPSEARNAFGDLHDLYKPFSPKFLIPSPVQAKPISSISSSLNVSVDPTQLNQVQKQRQVPRQFNGGSVNRTNTATHSTTANSNTSRSKKRKNQSKEMRRVPADALYSDIWAWRKYGQKPIKGSPYPRGYYRCSSSKGCMARKQVERDQSDPGMFKVTYSAEHNHPAPTHRNSLAGSTRQKPVTATETTTAIADKASPSASKPARSSSPVLSVAQSQNSESREEKDLISEEDDGEGEEEEFGVSDSALDDDFFAGLDELAAGDCFSDPFPSASFGHQWLTNNAAAAAGSI